MYRYLVSACKLHCFEITTKEVQLHSYADEIKRTKKDVHWTFF